MDKEQPQVKTEAPVDTAEPVFHDDNKKSTPTGLIIGMVLLALIAIGGVGFGVWEMTSQSQKVKDLETQVANCAAANDNESTENVTVTCPDGTSTEIVKNVITNDLAQSLINPYLGTFNYLSDIMDYTFDDAAKMVVSFYNIRPDNIYVYQNDSIGTYYQVNYDALNKKFQEMFGSSSSLEKKDYNPGYSLAFTYTDEYGGRFEVKPFNGGGAGSAMFSVVKNANYNDEIIIVNVYHDKVPICEASHNDGYCIETDGAMAAVVNSINKFNMRDIINNFADRIPVYTMTFVRDNGHYVLNNIQKQ